MRHPKLAVLLASGGLGIALAGCAPGSYVMVGNGEPHGSHDDHHEHGYGPPPHAPAHGYRHRHRHHGHDVEMVFDSGLGAYVVVGFPGYYFWDGFYLRMSDGYWYASASIDGGWKPCSREMRAKLPPGLAKKMAKGRKGKKKHHPAKGRW